MTDTPHPAKFSAPILDLIQEVVHDVLPAGSTILDPFGGVGLIHQLRHNDYDTFAIELEPEWAAQSARLGPTWCGDFFKFNAVWQNAVCLNGDWPGKEIWPAGFDAVITSPTYANRMADNHNAQERCRACMGIGSVNRERAAQIGQEWDDMQDELNTCMKCGGQGKRNYKRMTYTHQLGRPLSENNSGGMRWGNEYRWFHMRAWTKVCRDILSGAGAELFIINVKNHIRNWEEVDVAGWHAEHIAKLDMVLIEDYKVPVKGMGYGENRDARVASEHVMVFRGKE